MAIPVSGSDHVPILLALLSTIRSYPLTLVAMFVIGTAWIMYTSTHYWVATHTHAIASPAYGDCRGWSGICSSRE